MTKDQIIELMKDPERVLDVGSMEQVIDWSTFFIYQLEEELLSDDFQVDTIYADLIKKHDKVNKAEAALKLTNEYRARAKKEILLKSIKSYRANIRKKRDRLINQFR